MRVVLDTNVLVSGIFFHGTPGKILDAWVDERFSLFVTPSILDEYARVIIELTAGPDEFLSMDWLHALYGLCHMVPDSTGVTSYSRDPKDDKFVSCALAAKADYLVSGDKDISSIETPFLFKIVSPAKLLSELNKK